MTPYSLLTPIHFLFLFPSLDPLHLLTQFLSFLYLLPISPPLSFDFFVSHQRKMLGVYFRVSKRNKLLDKYSLFPLAITLLSLYHASFLLSHSQGKTRDLDIQMSFSPLPSPPFSSYLFHYIFFKRLYFPFLAESHFFSILQK